MAPNETMKCLPGPQKRVWGAKASEILAACSAARIHQKPTARIPEKKKLIHEPNEAGHGAKRQRQIRGLRPQIRGEFTSTISGTVLRRLSQVPHLPHRHARKKQMTISRCHSHGLYIPIKIPIPQITRRRQKLISVSPTTDAEMRTIFSSVHFSLLFARPTAT